MDCKGRKTVGNGQDLSELVDDGVDVVGDGGFGLRHFDRDGEYVSG